MKTFLLLPVILFLFGCNKGTIDEDDTTLSGEWIRVEEYISPGNGGSWHPVNDNPAIYIRFGADGSLQSNHHVYAAYNRYELRSDTLFFITPAGEARQHWPSFSDGHLQLMYACICGCGDKYVRRGKKGGTRQ